MSWLNISVCWYEAVHPAPTSTQWSSLDGCNVYRACPGVLSSTGSPGWDYFALHCKSCTGCYLQNRQQAFHHQCCQAVICLKWSCQSNPGERKWHKQNKYHACKAECFVYWVLPSFTKIISERAIQDTEEKLGIIFGYKINTFPVRQGS